MLGNVLKGLVALVVLVTVFRCTSSPEMAKGASTARSAQSLAAADPAKERAKLAADCRQTIDAKQAEYKRLMSQAQYWPAALAVRNCAEALDSAQLRGLVKEAEVKSHLADINSPKSSSEEKARAMEMLLRDYPDIGKKYESQIAVLHQRAAAEQAKATAAFKRSQGVRIGMSMDDVRASSWGRPRSVNRTTTAYGVREQWVYDGGYLYFKDGVLETIQN